jgi:two-component system chemotaxis response regulator CheY
MAKSLLLVDDSVSIREVVSLTFETTDLTIRTASNLDEALAALEQERAEVVIADADKAEVGGWELCRRLKDIPENESIRVVLLAGDDDEASRPLDVAPDALVSKPFTSDKLFKVVAALIHLDPGPAEPEDEAPREDPIEAEEPAIPAEEEEPLNIADFDLEPAMPPPEPSTPSSGMEEPPDPSSAAETAAETDDLRPAIETAVRQSLSSALDGLNGEELRGLIADAIRDALKDITPQLAGLVEQVAREVVPELAEIWIEREILRLKEGP